MKDSVKEQLSQEHAEYILENVTEGVFTVDPELKITYFNAAAEKLAGTPREKALGQYCCDVMRTNICESNCLMARTFKTGEQIRIKFIDILRPDGHQLPISVCTSVLKNKSGKMIGGLVTFRDLSDIQELRKEIHQTYTFEDIVSKNHRVMQLFDFLPYIAESDSTVLLQGPSGSGKELFARAIHNMSLRKNGPFIAVNCGALPETLLESELFGYVKGAFTDAKKDKPGRFSLAKGGTILLDEIESLSQAMQVKLLRVLQERVYEPLGSTVTIKADVRIVAASKDDLAKLVAENKFRDDLYYRINIIALELPPLKERRDDIPLLIQHFIEKFNRKMDRGILRVSDEVMEVLMQYDYPGNIRQLENIIEHSFVMCKGLEIELKNLPPEFSKFKPQPKISLPQKPLQNAECEAIVKTLKKYDFNKVLTAQELGLHRSTLWRKMKHYGLM